MSEHYKTHEHWEPRYIKKQFHRVGECEDCKKNLILFRVIINPSSSKYKGFHWLCWDCRLFFLRAQFEKFMKRYHTLKLKEKQNKRNLKSFGGIYSPHTIT